ncbi:MULTISPECIES: DUF3592 domain-containing protein [unclassified Streptomyces]|uniref:DUF3592 domain-containing protein n=1 Tax=unclassified Streptomyces TaxID=2593676 RepID=UPI002E29AC67|nr:DUF3592 domain-containing protein [Streptomyces sp. NBC_01423]WSX92651.1 DUF3592 domain-containing protein [Streptomyces sp. NBC_00891]WSY07128.1 DUF3592 domain-containing protein [Streptomyces sp. NBC_00890]WSZ08755.1 DUF3592 domain-containing protein [Streptomyces sp. NBC_00869]WSZ23747.1 DUF3592 domain-containing protein [Streptomyces sp. NBC_00870]
MVVLFAIAGSFAVYFAYRETRVQRDLKRHGTLARGRVVRHHVDSAGRGTTAAFAVIEFADTEGVLHTFQAQASGVKRLPVGNEVPVRYRADYPTIARIDLAGKKRANILIPLLVGALFFGGAVAVSLDQGGSHAGHGR